MGIWDCVCSVASSCCRAVGGLVSSCVSGIKNVCSSVGPALTALGAVLKFVPVVGGLGAALMSIGRIASAVAVALGIIRPDETMEDIGDRALQAGEEGITLESCKNFDEYMAKVRATKLDPEKSAQTPLENKLMAGYMVLEKGIQLKEANLSTLPLMPLAGSSILTPERCNNWVNAARALNLPLASVAKFFLGAENFDKMMGSDEFKKMGIDLPSVKSDDGVKIVKEAEKNQDPGATNGQLVGRINTLREGYQKEFGENLAKLESGSESDAGAA